MQRQYDPFPYSNSTDTTIAGSDGRNDAPSMNYDIRCSPEDLDASRGSVSLPTDGIAAAESRPRYMPNITGQGGL